MTELRKVRTTMAPDTEIEVGEEEYTDLSRQGLLVEGDGNPTQAETTAATEQSLGIQPRKGKENG